MIKLNSQSFSVCLRQLIFYALSANSIFRYSKMYCLFSLSNVSIRGSWFPGTLGCSENDITLQRNSIHLTGQQVFCSIFYTWLIKSSPESQRQVLSLSLPLRRPLSSTSIHLRYKAIGGGEVKQVLLQIYEVYPSEYKFQSRKCISNDF